MKAMVDAREEAFLEDLIELLNTHKASLSVRGGDEVGPYPFIAVSIDGDYGVEPNIPYLEFGL